MTPSPVLSLLKLTVHFAISRYASNCRVKREYEEEALRMDIQKLDREIEKDYETEDHYLRRIAFFENRKKKEIGGEVQIKKEEPED